MIITLKNAAGTSSVTLVHGSGRPASDYAQGPLGTESAFDSNISVQISPAIRSEYSNVITRGNRTGTYPFSAIRVFASADLAFAWAAQHAIDMHGKSVMEIGAPALTKLTGGISKCTPRVRGVSVLVDYTFVYGKVEAIIE
jgi:hypothetical protein